MSLKSLLPEGTYGELTAKAKAQARGHAEDQSSKATTVIDGVLYVRCPNCGRQVRYSKDNPYRPFCSERCRLLDLGAWANEERTVPGNAVNADEDADLLNDPALPRR